jgi:NADH-quinone oxidoreductase subunit L
VLWAVGLLTALLTAYYMTRQVIMVFYGEAKWHDAKDEHGHEVHPHESPALMWIPLVVLSVGAAAGGLLNLPLTKNLKFLEHWLEPIVGENEVVSTVSTTGKIALAVIAVAIGAIGIVAAIAVYAKHKAKAVEPAVLANAWYVDQTYAAFMGGPGREAFETITYTVDAKGVDGAVNGVAWLVKGFSGQLRKLQTGYVRNYAVLVAIGAVVIVAWFASRGVL